MTLDLGSSVCSGDLHDILHAEQLELPNLPGGPILVRKSPTDKLEVLPTWRVGKNRNSGRDAGLDEVRRFECTGAIGVGRYDDDVGGRNRFGRDQRPSCGSQKRLPDGGNNHGSRRG